MSRREWTHRALEILALTSFACAQPLFDVLGHQATFFVAHRVSGLALLGFAAVVLLMPPIVLLGVVAAATRVAPSAGRAVHQLVIGTLLAMTVIPPLARALHWQTPAWCAGALLLTGLTAWGYRRSRIARETFAWAAAAPVGFLAVFLVGSPARPLLFTAGNRAQASTPFGAAAISGNDAVAPAATSDAPIVLLVLDELPLAALQRTDGSIDGARFPHFARLASRATWYPRAVTNADGTAYALPALLTGSWLREPRLPTAEALPNNLLAYFARHHAVYADEFLTAFCKQERCGGQPKGRFRSLLSDAAVVYLHATLPSSLAQAHLPSLSGRWSDFTEIEGEPRPTLDAMVRGTTVSNETERFSTFLEQLAPLRGPRLWYLHLGLPHVPWRFLPSGQAYYGGAVAGLAPEESWQLDPRATDHALQRFLLQLTFVDRLLGRLLDRLHETGLDETSLLIVAADHGESFRAGGPRRDVDATNARDVLSIPLFVKYPGQRDGLIDRRSAALVDIVPTIMHVLGVPLPWPVDGRSLRGPESSHPSAVFTRAHGLVTIDAERAGPSELSTRIASLFSGDGHPDDLYRIGEHRTLLGQSASTSIDHSARRLDVRVHVDQPEAYQDVDPQSIWLPAMFTATLTGPLPAGSPVAVALNGTIAGLGWTLEGQRTPRVTVLLAPHFFRRGRNRLEIFNVTPQSRLLPLELEGEPSYELVTDGSTNQVSAIRLPEGRQLAVRSGTVQGHVEQFVSTGGSVRIIGWALDPARQRVPERFLAVQKGRQVATLLAWPREDVATHFELPALTDAGLELTTTAFEEDADIQIYALFDDAAYLMPWMPQTR